MSYILEALKKAEAERNGSAPPMPLVPSSLAKPGKRQPQARRPALWIALAATACALGTLFWFSTVRTKPEAATPMPSVPALTMAPPLAAIPEPPPAQQENPSPTEKAEPTPKAPVQEKKPSPPSDESKPASATPAEPPVLTLRELPEQIQREIPPLTIGGYIYSGNKADRSVLINTRLARDGDEIAPALRLEKMMPDGMVLNYKGYRYRTSY